MLRALWKTQKPAQHCPAPHRCLFGRKPGRGDGFIKKIPVEAGEASDFSVWNLAVPGKRALFWLSGASVKTWQLGPHV